MTEYTEFHDGSLDGFMKDGSDLVFFLRTEGGEEYAGIGAGLVAFSATGFAAGSVILDVIARPALEINRSDIFELYRLRGGAEDATVADGVLQRAQDQCLTVIEINPSYGGSCLALVRSFELLQRDIWKTRLCRRSSSRLADQEPTVFPPVARQDQTRSA